MPAAALYEAMQELVRIYQFRDRDRACYGKVTPNECYALEAIERAGALAVGELAAALGLHKSNASRLVDALVAKRYVARRADPRDGRGRRLTVTARGGAALARSRGLATASPPAPSSAAPADSSPAVARNAAFALDRELTAEGVAASHNIFDEFAAGRDEVARATAGFRTSPWKLHVGGLVKSHRTFEVAELLEKLGLEERLYRHRCVEAWAMAVPWVGFPLAKLVALCEPLAERARFVRFVSAARPDEMPGWYASRRVFPYYEALTIEEATCELAFVATGIYGHPLPPQHGAPIRLVLPWKYGFKSAKSIVAIQFTDERPGTFWNDLSPRRYAWSSSVDPAETNPWPQSHETMLGTGERRATLPFNGYGDWVARLYA